MPSQILHRHPGSSRSPCTRRSPCSCGSPSTILRRRAPGVVTASPQSTEHVCVSFAPASLYGAVTLTVVFTDAVDMSTGAEIDTDGTALDTVTVVESATAGLTPSFAVSVAVYVPSSVQMIVVSIAPAAANEHVAPASTPAPAM